MPRPIAAAAAVDPIRASVLGLGAAALTAAVALAAPQPAEAQSFRAPEGSYQRTCRDITAWGGILRAECRDERSGQWRRSELNYRDCRGSDIFNFRGVLSCSGDPRNPRPDLDGPSRDGRGPWDRGPWGRSGGITVYEDAGFRGRSLTFRDQVTDLRNTGLNDRISSMRVQGTWEACSDAWFRGECRRFSGDVWNLQDQRFNDRISSLRRVR